jgi:hypothetical protein
VIAAGDHDAAFANSVDDLTRRIQPW